jgi:hypothetical protein
MVTVHAPAYNKPNILIIYNLRRDPFERADFNSNTYFDWMVDHVPQLYLMQAVVASQIKNFVKYPPRQKPASFNLDAVLAMVSSHGGHTDFDDSAASGVLAGRRAQC